MNDLVIYTSDSVVMEPGENDYVRVPLNELSAAQISKLDPFRDDPVIDVGDVDYMYPEEAELEAGNDNRNKV